MSFVSSSSSAALACDAPPRDVSSRSSAATDSAESASPSSVPHDAQVRTGCIDAVLATRHAGTRKVRLRYELAGSDDAPVVLVAGGISAHRHLAAHAADPRRGWAEALVGEGRALDPARVRLLAFDYIGAEGELDAPIDTADQADAAALLLDALRIERLRAWVGYSYGALVGLQFTLRHGPRVQRLCAAGGAHRADPYSAAWRALQRKAVALGQLQCDDAHGLSLARQFAMLSYRTPEEFAERFDDAPSIGAGRVRVAAEDWLDAAGTRFAARTDATGWLRLSESIDLHRVDATSIRVPTTVLAFDGDRVVPLHDAVALVEALGEYGRLRVLRSRYGHDAFLKDTDRIDALLRVVLDAETGTHAVPAAKASSRRTAAPVASANPRFAPAVGAGGVA